jgi:hypothetical protein
MGVCVVCGGREMGLEGLCGKVCVVPRTLLAQADSFDGLLHGAAPVDESDQQQGPKYGESDRCGAHTHTHTHTRTHRHTHVKRTQR